MWRRRINFSWVWKSLAAAGAITTVVLLIYLGLRLLWQDSVLSDACAADVQGPAFANCLTAFTNDITFWGIVFGCMSLAAIGFGFWQNHQTQKREFKCYLRVDFDSVWFFQADRKDPDLTKLGVNLRVVNYGRSPATGFLASGSVWLKYRDLEPGQRNSFYEEPYYRDLHPGDPTIVSVPVDATYCRTDNDAVQRGIATVTISLVIQYEDVFGGRYTQYLHQAFSNSEIKQLEQPLLPVVHGPKT